MRLDGQKLSARDSRIWPQEEVAFQKLAQDAICRPSLEVGLPTFTGISCHDLKKQPRLRYGSTRTESISDQIETNAFTKKFWNEKVNKDASY